MSKFVLSAFVVVLMGVAATSGCDKPATSVVVPEVVDPAAEDAKNAAYEKEMLQNQQVPGN